MALQARVYLFKGAFFLHFCIFCMKIWSTSLPTAMTNENYWLHRKCIHAWTTKYSIDLGMIVTLIRAILRAAAPFFNVFRRCWRLKVVQLPNWRPDSEISLLGVTGPTVRGKIYTICDSCQICSWCNLNKLCELCNVFWICKIWIVWQISKICRLCGIHDCLVLVTPYLAGIFKHLRCKVELQVARSCASRAAAKTSIES